MRGVLNIVQYVDFDYYINDCRQLNYHSPAIPELLKTKGQIVATTSNAAHVRVPLFADYSVSAFGSYRNTGTPDASNRLASTLSIVSLRYSLWVGPLSIAIVLALTFSSRLPRANSVRASPWPNLDSRSHRVPREHEHEGRCVAATGHSGIACCNTPLAHCSQR